MGPGTPSVGTSQGIESLLRPLAPPQAPSSSPHPRDVGENKTMNQWDPVFLQPKAGHDAQWAGSLPSLGVGQKEELGFPATLKNLRAAGHGAGRRTSLALAGAGPGRASKPGGKQCGLASDPRYPCPGETAFGCKPGPDLTRGVFVTSVRGWIVPELDGHISQCQHAGRHRFTQWALTSLNPIGVVHRQVRLPGPSLLQAQLALVLDLSPTGTYLCSCLPALPTHLAVLRLL